MSKKLAAVSMAAVLLFLAACGKNDTSSNLISQIELEITDVSSETSSEDSLEAASSAESSKETSSKETSSKETSSKETSSKETSSKETSSKVTSSKETSSKETSSKQEEPADDGKISIAKVDFSKIEALYKRNSDTVGWIKIPNTNIDYGVVQEPEYGYYMQRGYDKEYNKKGDCIWGDRDAVFGTRDQLCKNTIIYGHNWTNCWRPIQLNRAKDTHFAQLAAYDYLSFAKKNPYISFSTREEEMYWQVFAVFYTEIGFNYIDENPDDITTITDEAKKRSIHNFDVEVTSSDKILTLSTCTRVYGKSDKQRFVVMAKLMPKGAELVPVKVTEHKDFKKPNLS